MTSHSGSGLRSFAHISAAPTARSLITPGFLKVDPAIDALRSAPCYAKAERRLYELAQLAL
jgi:hypothetical protein